MNISDDTNRIIRKFGQWAAVGFTCLALLACGGGSEESNAESETELSKLSVSLTDAEGDFLTYQVDVTELTLTRANGAVVNILPQTTSVDFAQYVEVTELLTILDAPSGAYTGASMSLDFSDALITVQNETGVALTADAVDGNGDSLSEIDVEISFNDRDGFVLIPGVPSQLTLDFDLDASNEIEISGDSATVIVEPILVADTILEEAKTFRLRGLLDEVMVDEMQFSMDLRPFRVRDGRFGNANVFVSDDTTFEIDGEVYSSGDGLLSLSEKPEDTAVVAHGAWDREAKEYQATAVYVGTSVAWDQADLMRGTVVSREGNTLSVRGAIVELAEGSYVFNETFSVDISENTNVTKRGDDENTIADISVGSAIAVMGEMSDTEESTMDASEGLVRILPSRVSGFVVSVSPLVVDMRLMNSRRASIYDFSGTGTSESTDAEADNYEINTASLDLANVYEGDPIQARGYTTDFGAAPEDLIASSIIDASNLRAHMTVGYGFFGAQNVIETADESSIVFSIEDALVRHHIARAGALINMENLEAEPTIVPGGDRGVFTIWINRTLEVYTYYNEFVNALNETLERNVRVKRIDAHGYFDRNANIFTSKRMGVILIDASVIEDQETSSIEEE